MGMSTQIGMIFLHFHAQIRMNLVVYALIRTEETMKTVVIAARSDDEVYEIAAKRREQ